MILYGASGHAKVIIDICKLTNQKISKIVDDNLEISKVLGIDVSHTLTKEDLESDELIISIGNNSIRKKIAGQISSDFGLLIHPTAVIDTTTIIEKGSVIMAGAVVNSSTKLGQHCIINTNASVDHDCFISNFVHISPNATLCGGVTVGELTQVGAGATILPNITIGTNCIVGAGSVIIGDIPDNCTVVGNPGRIIKN